MKQLRAGLADLVAQPAPDRAAIDARLVEIRGELEAMQSEVQKTVVDALLDAVAANARRTRRGKWRCQTLIRRVEVPFQKQRGEGEIELASGAPSLSWPARKWVPTKTRHATRTGTTRQ